MTRIRNVLSEIGIVIVAVLAGIAVLVAWCVASAWFGVRGWIARRIYDFDAPIRRIQGPFVLVLRSFADRMAYVQEQWTRPTADGDPVSTHRVLGSDVFGALLRACERETFVGIGNGRRLENLFMLNMPSEYWFEAFKILARHAKAILILPENTDGLLTEVQSVINEHTTKVTLLMPPNQPGVRKHTTDDTFEYIHQEIEREPVWNTARIAFESVGIKLPEYEPSGAFLRVGLDGELERVPIPWGGSNLAQLLQDSGSHGDAQAALRDLRKAGIPLVSISERERRSIKNSRRQTPPAVSTEGAIPDLDQLSSYQLEKRRQRAMLEQLLQRLTPDVPPSKTKSEDPAD